MQVGDNPEASIPPSSNPLMMAVTVDEDSDADIMYSTEWESSTDEENEPEVSPCCNVIVWASFSDFVIVG